MLYKIFDEIRKTCEKRFEYCKKSPHASKSPVSAWRTCLAVPKDDTKGEAKGEDAEIRVIELCSECDIRKSPRKWPARMAHTVTFTRFKLR